MRIWVTGGDGMGRSRYLKIRDRILALLEGAGYEMEDTGFGARGMEIGASGDVPLEPKLVSAIGEVLQGQGLEFGPAPKHIRIIAEPRS